MNLIQAIILGIVQGVTEFLPISSSAHLVIIPYFLGWQLPIDQAFPFNILVQLGTLVALIIYFWKDLLQIAQSMIRSIRENKPFKNADARLGWLVLLATLPAGIIGLFLKSKVESVFSSAALTAFFLFGTAFFLVIAEFIGKRNLSLNKLNWKISLLVGGFQAISVFPGISRSGACISGGMLQNLERKEAGRLSFLMAIPIMLAAGLLGILDLLDIKNLGQFLPILFTGFIVSGLVGYVVIHWFLKFLSSHSLLPFAIYCITLGALTLGFNFFRPASIQPTSIQESKQSLTVSIDSALSWIIPDINQCSKSILIKDIFYENPPDLSQDFNSDLLLSLDNFNPFEKNNHQTYQIGTDQLVLISNKSNPMETATKKMVQKIYENRMPFWKDLQGECTTCFNSKITDAINDKSINFWAYPAANPIQILFIWSIMDGNPITLSAMIAPDPQAMREAVQINPTAIGFLPKSWVNDDIKVIEIEDMVKDELNLPILAIIKSMASQQLKDLLLCLQASIVK